MHDILPVLVKLFSCFGVGLGVILVVWCGLLAWVDFAADLLFIVYCCVLVVYFSIFAVWWIGRCEF